MKAFLKKYKGNILYFLIISFLLFYFGPAQRKYYLDEDIDAFKDHYLLPILYWTFGLISVGLFVFWLIQTRSITQSFPGFLAIALLFAFVILFCHTIFLSLALFVNRQIETGQVVKSYKAEYIGGTERGKSNFILIDKSTGDIASDRKLENELYSERISRADTLTLELKKGLFGIVFKSRPFKDE